LSKLCSRPIFGYNRTVMDFDLETIASLAKRRGFIYQGSEIYGGLAGTWDYGPLGIALKRNLTNMWWKFFVEDRQDILGIDSAILMNQKVWQASGHVATFTDPLIEDINTKKRYRLDQLLEDNGINIDGMDLAAMKEALKTKDIKSPDGNNLADAGQFNLMLKTNIGSLEDENSITYLRPETAQGMFVNFKNILDSFYPDMPFGLAQIGRSFRNEISPRDFIFRVREFEIMEFEYFVHPDNWEEYFNMLHNLMNDWFTDILHLNPEHLHEHEISENNRAHYSKKTVDFEYDFPIGTKEIAGLSYRTDFDLKNHQEKSSHNMEYRPKNGGQSFIPHVIEPTFGVDRHILAVLCEAYSQDEINGEKRIFLKFPVKLAPVKLAVFPLLKNKAELVDKAKSIFQKLQSQFGLVMWDDNGNIGKRYRRQDEIGTPYCVTIDFQTLEDDTVTLRDRDTTKQERLKIDQIITKIL
jgi:glycyl-tRNA synthetase